MADGKPGRRRGLNINPAAVEDMLRIRVISKKELATGAGVSAGHLSEMLHSDKGASEETVRRMATVLDCDARTICPGLSTKFIYVRDIDLVDAEAVSA